MSATVMRTFAEPVRHEDADAGDQGIVVGPGHDDAADRRAAGYCVGAHPRPDGKNREHRRKVDRVPARKQVLSRLVVGRAALFGPN